MSDDLRRFLVPTLRDLRQLTVATGPDVVRGLASMLRLTLPEERLGLLDWTEAALAELARLARDEAADATARADAAWALAQVGVRAEDTPRGVALARAAHDLWPGLLEGGEEEEEADDEAEEDEALGPDDSSVVTLPPPPFSLPPG